MSKLKFNKTHRILVAATSGNHGYDMVDIDVENGTFHKNNVGQEETKIRVKKKLFAEKLCYNGGKDYNIPLKEKEALKIVEKFNLKREELGFKPLEFWRLGDDNE